MLIVARPVPLAPVRWWESPAVVAAIGLTAHQRIAIDRLYERRLPGRRHCVERLVAASNRVAQLIRDGIYDESDLSQTQAIALAAAEQRTLTRLLEKEIAGVLSPAQRGKLAAMLDRPPADR